MPHRFFIPPEWLTPPTVTLSGETARQIRTVLRMQAGAELVLLDNSGIEWQVRLTQIAKNSIEGQIIDRRPAAGEPATRITLYQGTLKGQKFEWVLQKGTELGLSRFVPTICHRSVVNKAGTIAKKRERWQRIIQEAAEQSGRGKLPPLTSALSFEAALSQARSEQNLLLMPWEAASESPLKKILRQQASRNLALFIGPEGGFTTEEASLAAEAGAHLVKLGPRVLRAETAGLAVCAAILYELGEWD